MKTIICPSCKAENEVSPTDYNFNCGECGEFFWYYQENGEFVCYLGTDIDEERKLAISYRVDHGPILQYAASLLPLINDFRRHVLRFSRVLNKFQANPTAARTSSWQAEAFRVIAGLQSTTRQMIALKEYPEVLADLYEDILAVDTYVSRFGEKTTQTIDAASDPTAEPFLDATDLALAMKTVVNMADNLGWYVRDSLNSLKAVRERMAPQNWADLINSFDAVVQTVLGNLRVSLDTVNHGAYPRITARHPNTQ